MIAPMLISWLARGCAFFTPDEPVLCQTVRRDKSGAIRLWAALLPLITACTPEVDDDLRGWAARVRSEAPEPASDAATLAVPAVYVYDSIGKRDPFDIATLSTGMNDADQRLRPQTGRSRDVLEAFQLDSLQMVGSLRRAGKAVAVVQAEQQLYPVRVGDHLGQDYGQVTAISESAIEIAERVQDSNGQWQIRATRLDLQRGSAK